MFTWVEIDKRALLHNILAFRKLIGKEKLLMPVIKSNAYGHGFLEVAKICEGSKEVDRICVVNSDEAERLVDSKITEKPIMILSFYPLEDKKQLAKLINHNVIFPIYLNKQAKTLNIIGKELNKKIRVHLKIDTGTSRIGIYPKEIANFVKNNFGKHRSPNLEIEGLWSHFASSEDDSKYTSVQYDNYLLALKKLKQEGIDPPIRHMACTAASMGFKFDAFNAIRLGIGLYGLYPSANGKNCIKLQPALTWKTKIIQIKEVVKGTKIGYGGSYTADKDIKLAILPVGYWDGYHRTFSNKASVIIHGKLRPIRGRICMNLCMVEIPRNLHVKVGDTVTLLGKDNKARITAEELAKIANTINYEIITGINPTLLRMVK